MSAPTKCPVVFEARIARSSQGHELGALRFYAKDSLIQEFIMELESYLRGDSVDKCCRINGIDATNLG